MAYTPNHIIITNPDGSTTTVDVTWAPPPVVTPPPVPTFPDGANTVTAGSVSFPLAAIDPPTTDPSKPAGRDTNQLIIVTKAGSPARNQWGWEVPVIAGKTGLGATNVSLLALDADYVLSGHGTAATFLKALKPGWAVAVTRQQTPTPPDPPQPLMSHPTLGVYLMDGVGHVSQVPAKCNRILVAFYQGTDLVEWGGDTPTQTATDLKKWVAARAGNEIVISLGGQGGTVVLDQVDEGMARINARFPVSGIDFDAEAFSYSTAQAVSIAQLSAAAVGKLPKDFIVQFVPPGGDPVQPALDAAKAVQAAGFRVQFGQQLYETSISDQDVMNQTAKAVAVLGAPAVLVGMMIGDSHNSWTVANAASRMQLVKSQWNDIGGAYLWESSRPGTAEWAAGVGAVLGL